MNFTEGFGKKWIDRILGKVDKDQGVANAGKVLGIGDDGQVVPVEQSGGGGDILPSDTRGVYIQKEYGGKTIAISKRAFFTGTSNEEEFDTSYRETVDIDGVNYTKIFCRLTYGSSEYAVAFRKIAGLTITPDSGNPVYYSNRVKFQSVDPDLANTFTAKRIYVDYEYQQAYTLVYIFIPSSLLEGSSSKVAIQYQSIGFYS